MCFRFSLASFRALADSREPKTFNDFGVLSNRTIQTQIYGTARDSAAVYGIDLDRSRPSHELPGCQHFATMLYARCSNRRATERSACQGRCKSIYFVPRRRNTYTLASRSEHRY